jgi:hypothetical protein
MMGTWALVNPVCADSGTFTSPTRAGPDCPNRQEWFCDLCFQRGPATIGGVDALRSENVRQLLSVTPILTSFFTNPCKIIRAQFP